MATGTGTYEGLAVPLLGESNIFQQTAATDILTITGSTGTQTGDFIVCENSTGTEKFVVSSSGGVTAVSLTTSGTLAWTGTLSATTAAYGMLLSVTSTGALTAGSVEGCGYLVSMSSRAVLNAVIGYTHGGDAAASGSVCNYFCVVNGSKAPTYFLGLGATTAGVGNPIANGFYVLGNSNQRPLSCSTATVFDYIKILVGDSVRYIPLFPSSNIQP